MAEVTSEVPQPEYPNSPLQSVVFEIRFPGEPAIECHRDKFFHQARNEFPRVLVPKLQAGEAVALSPYQFQRDDGSATLLTALNLFAFLTPAYPGFPRFRHDVLSWTRIFAELYAIGRLTRVGLRYTNVIPYAPSEAYPVGNFLDITLRLGVVESALAGVALSAVMPTSSGGVLTVKIERVESELDRSPGILLDFDHAFVGDLHVNNVERYLDDSHTETKRLFEGLLTDAYRRFLRGEGLE